MLAVASAERGIAWAVADPWEVRGGGSCRCRERSRLHALLRVVRREKPTAIVARDRRLRAVIAKTASLAKLPVIATVLPELAEAIARDLYPELRVRAPTKLLVHLALLAIRAVLHADIPSRSYAQRPRKTDRRER